jgi:hypothetical protein
MSLDITFCSPLKVSRAFGRTYRVHIQGSTCHLLSRWYLPRFLFNLVGVDDISVQNSSDIQRIARRYIPGDNALQTLYWFAIRSDVVIKVFQKNKSDYLSKRHEGGMHTEYC